MVPTLQGHFWQEAAWNGIERAVRRGLCESVSLHCDVSYSWFSVGADEQTDESHFKQTHQTNNLFLREGHLAMFMVGFGRT